MDSVEISEIKMTKKGRYALFCEEGFLFSVDEGLMVKYSIATGSRFSSAELDNIRKSCDLAKAKDRALTIVGTRSHSKKELFDKLVKHYDEYTARYCVDALSSYGYLDEESYAKECVNMFRQKKMSLFEAKRYLKCRGLDDQLCEAALEGYEEGEADRIKALVEKKYASKLAADRRKVISALYGKGFSMSSIKEALGSMEAGDEL